MFLPVTLELLTGFWETLKIFLLTLLFSIPLGLVVCFGSMSRFQPLRWLTRGIIWVIRGTPLMLQLIVVFYGPGLMFGLPSMGRFTAVILAFTINYACYFSEIYRGG
ncbi:MAG: ABC transporter permease subunit, partial [Faecousia sp.]